MLTMQCCNCSCNHPLPVDCPLLQLAPHFEVLTRRVASAINMGSQALGASIVPLPPRAQQ